MKSIDPNFLNRSREVFASAAPMTLQGLRDLVAAKAAGNVRRDMLSALDTAARVFGRPLSTIRATPGAVRDLFGGTAAAEVGLSPKRLANVRSDVVKALRLYGEPVPAITKRIPLTQAWSDLLGRVVIKHHRMALARLASFCSAMEIRPELVGSEALIGFHAGLEAEEVVKDPGKLLKATIANWNMCKQRVPGWPDIQLGSPFKTVPYTLPLTAFPASFQRDVETWAKVVTHPDPFDDHAPRHPLRQATVEGLIMGIRRFGSALVHLNIVTLERMTTMGVFFEGDHFKSGLRFFLARFDNKPTPAIEALASSLRNIAKHYCKVDSKTLGGLQAICERLDPGGKRQMSARNRDRLRQFDDPINVAKLLAFPAGERGRGYKQTNPLRAARCMERALAVDILIHCCLRIQNLRTIHLTKNLRVVGGKHYLSFEAHEVKNSRILDFELSDDIAQELDEFCKTYRPLLPGAEGPYLFPGEDGGAKSHSALRTSIGEALRTKCGLHMHPHLFRHAIAKIVVERDPALYPVISKHLGHARLDMTMAHYLGTETRASARHIDKLLTATRADPTLKKD